MIGDPGLDGWRRLKRLMNTREIVIHEMERDSRRVVLKLL